MPTNTTESRDFAASEPQNAPLGFLAERLPVEDLTEPARAGRVAAAVPSGPQAGNGQPDVESRMARALYRRSQPHVLLTGEKGIGKTTRVRELARRAAAGEFPFLAGKRFLRIDVADVGPEDSRGCLETLLLAAAEQPELVLCLDGLAALVNRPAGGDNKPLLRALARRPGLRIIGILAEHEYHEHFGGDAALRDLFTRIRLDEPDEETALEIARHASESLAREYGFEIDGHVVRRAVALTSNYLLGERHPAKAVKVLRQACEEADYARTQLGETRTALSAGDVIRIVAEKSGIPQASLAGEAEEVDLRAALQAAVVGQEAAVAQVAAELDLIKAGLTEPGQPAAVLLFAGMTGVGKTELAKRVAELYSSSKRLTTYAMGNYTEPHSVSGIIGVPPGYVGHEHGGRLVNELNADPYSVFLLDEAEKAHPDVWKPFLNLFDEGWLIDRRGVKAYADRAIFILTTNAGERAIAQMSRSGQSEETIVHRVKAHLARAKQERSSQPVFTPQFLARIKRILVFRPLDEAAMTGIAGKAVERMQVLWRTKREKTVRVCEELVELLGRHSHALNKKADGKEGGRIVRKLLSDKVESRVQREAMRRSEEYKACRRIVVRPSQPVPDDGECPDEFPEIAVDFER